MQKLYSVIIPARNDAARLRECLSALAPSLEEGGPGEVILVNDGSTDDTARVAAEWGARVVSLPGLGPAAARNRGAGVARGELLLFLDADCVPAPGYLEALLAPFRDPQVAGARGGYSTLQRSPLARFVQLEMEEKQARLAASHRVALLDTACAAYRRSVFLEEGGFDERYPATSVEDAELSFRLAQRGRRLVYAPGALVRHRHPEGLGIYLWRKLRFGFFRAQLYGRYPGRIREDGYTPRAMPLQIALAGGMAAAAAASPWSGRARTGLAAGALAFLGSALPMMRRAWRVDRPLTPLVPPMLLARSLAQGLGLLAGGVLLVARTISQGARAARPPRWGRRGETG